VFIMHSDGQTSVLEQPQETALSWDNTKNHGETGAFARRAFLLQEHRDLDDTIALLANDNASDEALLARLKKRKLQLKDELARMIEAAVAV
jgi:uncharacterized protein YdcH (DUF465 family)